MPEIGASRLLLLTSRLLADMVVELEIVDAVRLRESCDSLVRRVPDTTAGIRTEQIADVEDYRTPGVGCDCTFDRCIAPTNSNSSGLAASTRTAFSAPADN